MTHPGISQLELRQIIESAFLPQRCVCTSPDNRSFTVQFYAEDGHSVVLTVTGIAIDSLTSQQALAALVADLRMDLSQRSGDEVGMPLRSL